MIFMLAAAFALTSDPTPDVAGTPLQSNLEYSDPIAGDWTYAATTDGSQAVFANSSGQAQMTIRCTKSTRRVALLKPASSASPSMWIWTSSRKQSSPATYDASTAQVSVELGPYDPLLDAIASSRGRVGLSTSGLEVLVVPPWADIARVIEDCRI